MNTTMKNSVRILGVLSIAALAYGQTPPGQPANGPAGRSYSHSTIRTSGPFWAKNEVTNDGLRYWMFEPAGPAPANAPVILFLPGFYATDPAAYQYWMSHMVLKGYTVVWAQYEAKGALDTWNWANNAAEVMIDSLKRLDTFGRVLPARDNQNKYQTAYVGHSLGGFLGMVLAGKATRSWWSTLPQPKAVVGIEPGAKFLVPGEDYTRIPAFTKILFVSGEDDDVNCVAQADQIWSRIAQIPTANKDFLLVRSQTRGATALVANHYFPNNQGYLDTAAMDARDYFVTFKLSVAALNCTFRGSDCDIAFGKGSLSQTEMGTWSDGMPVVPMLWASGPAAVNPPCANR